MGNTINVKCFTLKVFYVYVSSTYAAAGEGEGSELKSTHVYKQMADVINSAFRGGRGSSIPEILVIIVYNVNLVVSCKSKNSIHWVRALQGAFSTSKDRQRTSTDAINGPARIHSI